MNSNTAELELEKILDSIQNRNFDFGKLYGFFMIVALFFGIVYDLGGGQRVGVSNEWFLLIFEISLFVLGLTILFSAFWSFKEVESPRIILYNFTRRGPLALSFTVAMLTLTAIMLLNFIVNPTFGALGLTLIFLGLGLEVPIASYYKYLTNEVYNGDKEETIENLLKMMNLYEEDK